MSEAQISRRVDQLMAQGIPMGEAIAQAVTEAHQTPAPTPCLRPTSIPGVFCIGFTQSA